MLVVFYIFLIWSCCYALGILLTRYLHHDSFQQSLKLNKSRCVEC